MRQQAKADALLARWKRGEDVDLGGYRRYIHSLSLRAVGETVETVRGHTVPLAQAQALLRRLLRRIRGGKAVYFEDRARPMFLGGWDVREIHADGSLQVGRTRIPRAAIEELAGRFGL